KSRTGLAGLSCVFAADPAQTRGLGLRAWALTELTVLHVARRTCFTRQEHLGRTGRRSLAPPPRVDHPARDGGRRSRRRPWRGLPMIGFLIGAACLFGLVKVLRYGSSCGRWGRSGWGRSGWGPSGCGSFDGRWSHRGWDDDGFGRRHGGGFGPG